MLAVKEVKFPLIVLTPIKVVEVEGKIPEPENAGNVGGSRLGRGVEPSEPLPWPRPHPHPRGQRSSLVRERQVSFMCSEKPASSCVKEDSDAPSRFSRKECRD